jgi:chorismate synthase
MSVVAPGHAGGPWFQARRLANVRSASMQPPRSDADTARYDARMSGLRYLTAGESHGAMLSGILDGIPARVPLLPDDVDRDLQRRQHGHGRGGRMRIEEDRVRIVGGVRDGVTMGGPIALFIENRDAQAWEADMGVEPGIAPKRPLTVPRPGHADLAGYLKWGWRDDLRPILERASARETAMRVAVGAVARRLLAECGVEIASHVLAIGGVEAPRVEAPHVPADLAALRDRADASPVRCLDEEASHAMVAAIDSAGHDHDSVGGIVEILASGVPAGLGSCTQWDRKLDGRLAGALTSIQAVKGVEIGDGFALTSMRGSRAHDPIAFGDGGWSRGQNRAGGLEGGMTTGEPLILRVAKKPISTLMRPLASVDVRTGAPADAHVERADTCAVPALGVICEAVVALTIAGAVLECFGGDTIEELQDRVEVRRRAAHRRPGSR